MVNIAGAVDSIRIYDQGVKNWLTANIKLMYVTPIAIPNVFASPEKVYGEMTRLQSQGVKLRPRLPFISITRSMGVRNANKYNVVDIRSLDWVDSTKKAGYSTNYPVAVDISYQFDVWMNFADDKNRIEEVFQLLFNHPVYLTFTVDGVTKNKVCYFTLDSVNDTSTLEPIMKENRVFRNTYTCTLQAMLYYGYTESKIIGTPQMIADGDPYYELSVYVANETSATMNPIVDNEWTLTEILVGSQS